MLALPRQPRGPEVVIELRLAVAANYKLGANSSSSSSSSKANAVTFADFLTEGEACKGENSSATATAATEDDTPDSSRELPPPRLFLGVVVATGASVGGLSEGSLVIVVAGVGPQQQFKGKFLFCLFSACVPIPLLLKEKLLICGGFCQQQQQLQQDQQQQQQEQEALERALARVPHLVEALECCTLRLRPRGDELIGVCCSRVDQIAELLFWLLPFNARIFVFAETPDAAAFDKLFSSPPLSLMKDKAFLLPLTVDLENLALQYSGGVGLSQLLVTPSAVEALQQQHQQHQHQQHQQQQQSGKSRDEAGFIKGNKKPVRSLMTLLLLCLGPGGSLVVGCPLGGLDEEEEAALLAKSAGVFFYNSKLLQATQGGTHIHFLVESLNALKEKAENLPGGCEAICFSPKEAAQALNMLKKNHFAALCLRLPPSPSAP